MVGKIWEDKWEYENFTYIVGDPLLKDNDHGYLKKGENYFKLT